MRRSKGMKERRRMKRRTKDISGWKLWMWQRRRKKKKNKLRKRRMYVWLQE
jgi:hypothetical protein